jgi:hypothetical protein
MVVDKGACPYDCCSYGEWRALRKILLVDEPGGKTIVATLNDGETVLALTGQVHTRPVHTKATKAAPDLGIKVGDHLYLLAFSDEGWRVWHEGRVIEKVPPLWEGLKVPQRTWWAQVKTPAGVTGWTSAIDGFKGPNNCAE